jgi:hypothetical protein
MSLKLLPVLGAVDDLPVGADHLDPELLQRPSSHRLHAQFSAVCPPSVAAGIARPAAPAPLLFWRIFRTASGVIGSMYVRSLNAGSVMIVARVGVHEARRGAPRRLQGLAHACVTRSSPNTQPMPDERMGPLDPMHQDRLDVRTFGMHLLPWPAAVGGRSVLGRV